jgi:hypothetical protein
MYVQQLKTLLSLIFEFPLKMRNMTHTHTHTIPSTCNNNNNQKNMKGNNDDEWWDKRENDIGSQTMPRLFVLLVPSWNEKTQKKKTKKKRI